jgi:16S rRNA (adenine1518-N6/adenine1519-N6)-dimethyltransferase
MPLYRPSELKEYLQSLGVSPKKRLSQNFLIDGNIIKKIIQLADVCPGESVLEIGPGPGALTEGLLEAGAHVLAVEKDPILAKHLEFLGKGEKFLRVICEDILTVDLEKHLPKGTKTKVIANLPYHLTTPILTRLIPLNKTFSSITVMVQEEVARRFAAIPGSKDYGSVTVFLQYYSEVQYGFKVSKNCFFPKPKVESAMVKFTLQPPPGKCRPRQIFSDLPVSLWPSEKNARQYFERPLRAGNCSEGFDRNGKVYFLPTRRALPS